MDEPITSVDADKQTPNLTAGDILPPWQDVCDRFTKVAKYFRTRRLVLAGDPLWDRTKSQLHAEGVMEPWQFNIYQSVLSAAPAIVIGGFLAFILPLEQPELQHLDETSKRAVEFAQKIQAFLLPLFVPIGLAITSFAAARGSLSRSDLTPQSRSRARRAYLYFDGAFGLWSQMIVASTPAFFIRAFTADLFWVGLFLVLAYTVAAFLQLRLTSRVIPMRLFELNGYPSTYPSYKFWRKDPNRKRWTRYTLFVFLFAGFSIWAVLILFIMISSYAAIGLVLVQDWCRHLIGVH